MRKRLILTVALAFGGAMMMTVSEAEAQWGGGGMRGGGKAGMRGGGKGMRGGHKIGTYGTGRPAYKRGRFGTVLPPFEYKAQVNPLKINNVPGVGPGYRGRHTVHGFVRTDQRLHGSAFYGLAGGFGGGGGWGGYGYGNGFGNFFETPYATGRIPTPPYFSIHPPVYYSHAVPRTYGHSPFAYPGTYRTPDVVVEPISQSIDNPYVEQTKTAKVNDDDESESATAQEDEFALAEPQPETIVNPYVDHPSQYPPAFDMEVTVAD